MGYYDDGLNIRLALPVIFLDCNKGGLSYSDRLPSFFPVL